MYWFSPGSSMSHGHYALPPIALSWAGQQPLHFPPSFFFSVSDALFCAVCFCHPFILKIPPTSKNCPFSPKIKKTFFIHGPTMPWFSLHSLCQKILNTVLSLKSSQFGSKLLPEQIVIPFADKPTYCQSVCGLDNLQTGQSPPRLKKTFFHSWADMPWFSLHSLCQKILNTVLSLKCWILILTAWSSIGQVLHHIQVASDSTVAQLIFCGQPVYWMRWTISQSLHCGYSRNWLGHHCPHRHIFDLSGHQNSTVWKWWRL